MQEAKFLRYMWTDSWCDRAARKNPMRWGKCTSASELLQLTSQRHRHNKDRPIRIHVETYDGHIEREFKDSASAAKWIQEHFRVESIQRSAAAHGLFGRCMSSTLDRSQEIEINPAANEMDHQLDEESTESSMDQQIVEESSESSMVEHPLCTGGNASMNTSQMQNDKQYQECATLRFMWADAGILPIPAMQRLAQVNPCRWSAPKPPRDVAKALLQAEGYWPSRPVLLEANMPGVYTKKQFDSAEKAMQWIQEEFELSEEDMENQEDHRCAICLDAQVSVMLMPCRHAVLCDACAESMLSQRQPCPICRTPVESHAHGHFASDFVDLVDAMESRMARTSDTVYTGMYNHVKPLMLTGAFLGTGAAVCFFVAPPAAPILGTAAFAIGYVPWFATTVDNFEREDLSAERRLGAHSFFSRQDLSSPLKLITKVVVMAVVAPMAAVAFFIPYGFYKGILKPISRALIHGLVRTSAFAHVYGVRPTAHALHRLGHELLQLLQVCGRNISDLTLLLGDMLVSASGRVRDLLLDLGHFLHRFVVIPCVHGMQRGGAKVAACSRATYRNVLVPSAQCIQRGASATAAGLAKVATTTYDSVLVPTGVAIHHLVKVLGNLLATGASLSYDYVLAPCGRGILLAVARVQEGIVIGANNTYSYFLVPCGQALDKALRLLGRGLAFSAEYLFRNVLVPLSEGTWKALTMLGTGLVTGAEFLYRNAVVPAGYAVRWTVQTIAKALTTGAGLTYNYVLVPFGWGLAVAAYGTYYVGSSLVNSLANAAVAIYSSVVVPLAGALATGASAIYVHALAPTGQCLYRAGAATARALSDALCFVGHGCLTGAQAANVYIILPCGQVIAVVFTNAGDAIRWCVVQAGAAVQAGSVAAGDAARACGHEVHNAAMAARAATAEVLGRA